MCKSACIFEYKQNITLHTGGVSFRTSAATPPAEKDAHDCARVAPAHRATTPGSMASRDRANTRPCMLRCVRFMAIVAAAAAAPPSRPDIVLMIADDIPRNMLGVYGAEHGLSPNLDRLAREGLTYMRAYTTAPLCTPSRFSLLTGRYASNASSITAHRPWNMVRRQCARTKRA